MFELVEQAIFDEESPEVLIDDLNNKFKSVGLDQLLIWGHLDYGSKMVMGTGFGPSGVVLIDCLWELGITNPIFYLDTRLLFDETYELKDRIEQRYDRQITRIVPEISLEKQAEKYGDKLWETAPDRCCYHRKVLPLRNYLLDKKVWITGLRCSQSKSRRDTQIIEWDASNEVIKLNPLAHWTDEDVWEYIRKKELPYNPLHDEGYPSIGCIPCTQPVNDVDEERAGRWNGLAKTECGIHRPSQKS